MIKERTVNKIYLVEHLIAAMRAEISELRRSFEQARETTVTAPCRMQSRFDTKGVEAAWVADGLARALKEKDRQIAELERFRPDNGNGKVAIGSVVELLHAEGGGREIYFIVPAGGGREIESCRLVIKTVTSTAPLGNAMIGKKDGEEVVIPIERPRTVIVKVLASKCHLLGD